MLLFDAYPHLRGRVAHLPLGTFPTRVERVVLPGAVPDAVELWCKRDDESGHLYGGNKVRKLEFLLAEAKAAGAERIATVGGFGSHHVLATGIYGRHVGLKVGAVVFPQPRTEHVLKVQAFDAAAGIELRATRGMLGVPLACAAERWRRDTWWIPGGGSSALGSLGYVEAGLEIRAQVARGELPRPDVVYVAMGSCGTTAGLWLGLSGQDPPELVGVRVVDRPLSNVSKVRRLASEMRRLCRSSISPPDPRQIPRLRVEHGFFGQRYGQGTPESHEAVEVASQAGLTFEETYTGKAFAALIADARSGRLDGKRVLFINTYSSADLAWLAGSAPGGGS